MTNREIALSLTKARGTYYQTGKRPTFEHLLVMVEEADNALFNTFGSYNNITIRRVVRIMLKKNDSASRICANPLSI